MNPMEMMQRYQQFRADAQNPNSEIGRMIASAGSPNALIQQLVQSGRFNQQALNQAQQMASMFGMR